MTYKKTSMENYFTHDTNEWLMKRLGRFTSSEISKLFVGSKKKGEIFGVGALSYIRTKAAELLTMEIKEEVDFKQAEWGKANEMDAVTEFQKFLGKEGDYYGSGNPKFFEYGKYAGGSPDWEIADEEGADVKAPFNTAEHLKNLLLSSVDDFKEERWEYYCQGQMNMLIRGWKKFHFVSYDPRMVERSLRLKVITIYPDNEWVREFNERLSAAIEKLEEMITTLEKGSVVIARQDSEVAATIVEPANL